MSYLSTNSSTSSSSSKYATSTASKRFSGLMSGLDTDELVKQMTMGTQNKIDSQLQKKQLATWQQEAYRNVTKAITEFQSKYFKSDSSSSILSPDFFNSTSIVNNYASYLNISGSASNASKMQIKSISNLAKQASMYSSHRASNDTIKTGEIKSEWTKSAITNSTITLNFENKDYTLTVGKNGSTTSMTDLSAQITEQLKDLGLDSKIEFTGNQFQSKSSSEITIKSGSANLLSGLGLKAGDKGTKLDGTGVNQKYFENHSIAAGSKLKFTIDGEEHTLTLTSAIELSVEDDISLDALKLKSSLESMIKANSDLKDKLEVSVTNDGKVTFGAKGKSLSVETAGSTQSLLDGLNIGTDGISKGSFNKDILFKSNLADSLAGSTMTFDLNGLSKTISFDETARDNYNTPEKLQKYLQDKLDAAFGGKFSEGTSKVTVGTEGEKLTFKAVGDTNILTVKSSSKSGVLGMDGAFGMYAGESTRLNTNKTLRDIADNMATVGTTTALKSANGAFNIEVNGKKFEFKETDTLDTVIKKINNDADANVTISYSNTTNTFSVEAKNGGASSKVDLKDNGGNLIQNLFGTSNVTATSAGSDAEMEIVINGQTQTITRSSNKFTLDGVDFELLKETGEELKSPMTFTAASKTDDLVKKIKDYVDDYNNILNTINEMIYEKKPTDGTYKPLTDSQKGDMKEAEITTWDKKAKQGMMFNDSLLSGLAQEWRSAMTNQVSSISTALYQIGIQSSSYSDKGKLTVDEDKLKEALNNDPEKVSALFTGTDGIATRMQTVMTKYTKDSLVDTGLLISKAGTTTSAIDQSDLAKKMKEYDTQVKALKVRLKSQQDYYYNKFTALETYIAKMNSQASFFNQTTS